MNIYFIQLYSKELNPCDPKKGLIPPLQEKEQGQGNQCQTPGVKFEE